VNGDYLHHDGADQPHFIMINPTINNEVIVRLSRVIVLGFHVGGD
jgi:hypothetical protein